MMLSFPLHTDLSKEVEINENLIIIRQNKSEHLYFNHQSAFYC